MTISSIFHDQFFFVEFAFAAFCGKCRLSTELQNSKAFDQIFMLHEFYMTINHFHLPFFLSPLESYTELENFAKTQGILFAKVVNSLIHNIQDIAIFAAKFSNFSKSVSHMK